MTPALLLGSLLVAVGLAKAWLLPFDPFRLKEVKQFYLRTDFAKTFVVPSIEVAQLASLDKKLFFAKLLDGANLVNKEFLAASFQWPRLVRASLALDPKDLDALIISAYQYSGLSKESFLAADRLIKEHIDLAQKNWRLMLLMSYLWQFRYKDLKEAAWYAKYLYTNRDAVATAREIYPILISKLGERQKAIALLEAMLTHTKSAAERRWIRQKIEELRHEKDSNHL